MSESKTPLTDATNIAAWDEADDTREVANAMYTFACQLEIDRAELIEALQNIVRLFHGYQGMEFRDAISILARLKVQP